VAAGVDAPGVPVYGVAPGGNQGVPLPDGSALGAVSSLTVVRSCVEHDAASSTRRGRSSRRGDATRTRVGGV
jgi:hypothetical protein